MSPLLIRKREAKTKVPDHSNSQVRSLFNGLKTKLRKHLVKQNDWKPEFLHPFTVGFRSPLEVD